MITKHRSSARKLLESVRGDRLKFGAMLKSIRICDQLSQIELAKKLKVSRGYLTQVENSQKQVTPQQAARFAKVLGYSINQFVACAIEEQLRDLGLQLKIEVVAA